MQKREILLLICFSMLKSNQIRSPLPGFKAKRILSPKIKQQARHGRTVCSDDFCVNYDMQSAVIWIQLEKLGDRPNVSVSVHQENHAYVILVSQSRRNGDNLKSHGETSFVCKFFSIFHIFFE